jgi:hypothetical protein
MGISFSIYIIDTVMIDIVDPHFTGSVDNFVSFPKEADVDDVSLLIVKKGEIARGGLFDEAEGGAHFYLLRGISWDGDSCHFIDDLGKAAAVDAKGRAPSPQIRGIEIFKGLRDHERADVAVFTMMDMPLEPDREVFERELLFIGAPEGKAAACHHHQVLFLIHGNNGKDIGCDGARGFPKSVVPTGRQRSGHLLINPSLVPVKIKPHLQPSG